MDELIHIPALLGYLIGKLVVLSLVRFTNMIILKMCHYSPP